MVYPIDRLQPQNFGRVGDGGTKTIQFDCSAWLEKNPELTTWYVEAITPNGKKYTPDTTMEGNILNWPITKNDTLYAGYGEYMIIAEGNDGTQKTSASPPFIVLELTNSKPSGGNGCDCGCGSENDSGNDSDATLEELTALVNSAEAAVDKAMEAVDRAEEAVEQAEEVAARAEEATERAEEAAKRAEDAAEDGCDCVGGSISAEHDGQGNVVFELTGLNLVDDGKGNISIT